jgi:hypothetical protein
MNTTRHRNAARGLLLSVLMLAGIGVSAGHAGPLEEVVAHGTRADTEAAHARFEATMDAYADGINAAFKDEMRRQIAERARPRLRVTLAAADFHRS